MPTYKSLSKYDTDDLVKIVNEDMKASEDARIIPNEQNLKYLKTFHCVEWDKPLNQLVIPGSETSSGQDQVLFLNNVAGQAATVSNSYYAPFSRTMILTLWALISGSLFPNEREFIKMLAQTKDDEDPAAAWHDAAHYLYREIGYFDTVDQFIIQALIADAAIMYTGWKTRPAAVPLITSVDRGLLDKPEAILRGIRPSRKQVKFRIIPDAISLPDYRVINIFNFRPDPNSMDGPLGENGGLFNGVTAKVLKSKIHAMAENGEISRPEVLLTKAGKLRAGFEEEVCGGDDGDMDIDYERIIRDDIKGMTDKFMPDADSNKNYYRVHWYFTEFEQLTVLNHKYLINYSKIPFNPFIKGTSYPEPVGSFSSTPAIRDTIHTQYDINTMIRSRRNRQDRDNNPRTIIDKSQFTSAVETQLAIANDPEVPVLFDGSANPLAKGDPIRFLVNPTVMDDTRQEIQDHIAFAEKALGISPEGTGGYTPGRRTATESNFRNMGMDNRMRINTRRFGRFLIVQATENLYKLSQIYLNRPLMFRIVGKNGVDYREYTTEDFIFKTSPDIQPAGPEVGDLLQQNRDLYVQALGMVMGNPQFAQYINIIPSLKELYRVLGVRHPDELLNIEMPSGHNIPVAAEIQLLKSGIEYPIGQAYNLEEHYRGLMKYINSPDFKALPRDTKLLFDAKAREYYSLLQQKRAGGQPGAGIAPPQIRMAAGPQIAQGQTPVTVNGAGTVGTPGAMPQGDMAQQLMAGTTGGGV